MKKNYSPTEMLLVQSGVLKPYFKACKLYDKYNNTSNIERAEKIKEKLVEELKSSKESLKTLLDVYTEAQKKVEMEGEEEIMPGEEATPYVFKLQEYYSKVNQMMVDLGVSG